MTALSIAKRGWIPAGARRYLRRLLGRGVFSGDYTDWAEARAAARGYEAPEILQKTVAAARAVRDGEAAWERDSVLFHEPLRREPMVSVLRRIASENQDRLFLLDFGGSLGSSWWQHRPWLRDLAEIRWHIVEQPHWVQIGARDFASGPLQFHASLEAGVAAAQPTAILLSSVLPYLESPHDLLHRIDRLGIKHVIIDRTGFVTRDRDRLTVQKVPASIYPASYPCWFFSREKLLLSLGPRWRIVEEWPTDDEVDIDAHYAGLWLTNDAA